MQPRKVPLQGPHRYAEAPGYVPHAGSRKGQRLDHGMQIVDHAQFVEQDFAGGVRICGNRVKHPLRNSSSRAKSIAGDDRRPCQCRMSGAEIEGRQADARLRARWTDDQHIAAAIGEDGHRFRVRSAVGPLQKDAVCDHLSCYGNTPAGEIDSTGDNFRCPTQNARRIRWRLRWLCSRRLDESPSSRG